MTQAHIELAGPARIPQGPVFARNIVEAVSRALAQRQTRRALVRLDDHLLADIGLTRGDIGIAVAKAVARTGELRSPDASPWAGLAAWFQQARTRARAIRELERLPERILDDIGVQRWRIAEAVDGGLNRRGLKIGVSRPARGELSPVHGLLARVEVAAGPFRQGRRSRLDTQTPSDLGYVQGDAGPAPAANRNAARQKVA